MRVLLCHCNSSSALPLSSSSASSSATLTNKPPIILSFSTNNNNWAKKALLRAFTGALSLNLLLSSPFSLASVSSPPSVQLQSPSTPPNSSIENCSEEEENKYREEITGPQAVTNEGIVEEAWQIVNDSFLDTGRHRWTPESWQQKREDILSTSIQSRSKAHDIIKRMLASLGDPYTRFLSPAEGDEVLAVNGEDVRGKSAFEVSSLLQGPNETFVTIKVKHGNCGPIQSLEVQRQLIARTPVFYRLEQVNKDATSVGYVRLKEFNALAKKDLVIAMKRLQDMGASYFVLDLRDNLGGLVQAGIEISKLFLNEGKTVIYTVGKDPQYQNTIVADTAPLVTAPVIVLVNNKTASASEIVSDFIYQIMCNSLAIAVAVLLLKLLFQVASALHDNCRAVLVGERTFGKGLIQSVFELRDGSGVVVTVGKYVTPNHMDINGNGIEPDYRNFPAWGDVTRHLLQCNMNQQG
ncbi:carboxyl-terminal-processing peptidase 1, chloroplastic isoform X3 [Jatropha curcas]|uniref:carboxyl-terminal-processing peptidase 1, chloroplastic isoform X3 n=1 Tax=Jatropha curcas TaxID=180498 RepID=UPI0005FBA263|nr:carboxyl-terminal-processing peptidase 1, chloroplastic isoform X3 [Jatropha curcas]